MKETLNTILSDNKKRMIFLFPLFIALLFSFVLPEIYNKNETQEQNKVVYNSNMIAGDTLLNNTKVNKTDSYSQKNRNEKKTVKTDDFLNHFNKQNGKESEPELNDTPPPNRFIVRRNIEGKPEKKEQRETYKPKKKTKRKELEVYNESPSIPTPKKDNNTNNLDFSTLNTNSTTPTGTKELYNAVIHMRGKDIKSGAEVEIRIKETATFSGKSLKSNTKLRGKANFNGERMTITINRFIVDGNWVKCNIIVLDQYGIEGLYVEDHINYKIAQDESDDAIESNPINISTTIGTISTDILKKKKSSAEASVPVPDGYKIFLKQKQ